MVKASRIADPKTSKQATHVTTLLTLERNQRPSWTKLVFCIVFSIQGLTGTYHQLRHKSKSNLNRGDRLQLDAKLVNQLSHQETLLEKECRRFKFETRVSIQHIGE